MQKTKPKQRLDNLRNLAERGEEIDPEAIKIGKRLRSFRENRKLTFRELARLSGVHYNTISRYETGAIIPDLLILQQLGKTLKVPLKAFFSEPEPPTKILYLPKAQQPIFHFPNGSFSKLGLEDRNLEIRPYLLTLTRYIGDGSESIQHAGWEYLHCLEGPINVVIEEERYTLEAGDRLLFDSSLPHRWYNAYWEEGRLLVFFYPAEEGIYSYEGHFR